jgi:lysophospholipase L1-like esterase
MRKVVLAVAAALVALEALLQLGALAVAWFAPAPKRLEGAAVLCIGDSFTFGSGSTTRERSYPGALQQLLRDRGHQVTVANAGYPGQHSGDLLTKLPAQMTPETKVLCVLVGANDAWRHPERAPAPSADAGAAAPQPSAFRLEWRTGRLLALLRQFEMGSWVEAGSSRALPEAGSARIADAEAKAAEVARGFELLAASKRLLDSPLTPHWTPVDPALDQAQVRDSWRLMTEDPPRAVEHVANLLAAHPGSPQLLSVLAEAASRGGQQARADAACEQLRLLAEQDRSPMVVENLARALLQVGRTTEAYALAMQRVAEDPLAVAAWQVAQRASFLLGMREESMRAMERTVNLVGTAEPWLTASIARRYARWVLDQEPALAAQLVTASVLIDGDDSDARVFLMQAGDKIARPHFEAAIDKLDGAEGLRLAKLRALLDAQYSGAAGSEWQGVLGEHLRDIVAFARSRGVEVVFLTYPFPQVGGETVLRGVAADTQSRFVPIRERFERELTTRKRDELFVADGHCNDAGYAIMAAMVADAVGPLLR